MFGKKEKKPKKNASKESPKEVVHAKVQVMPDAFYGGKDPVIFESRTKQKPPMTSPKKTIVAEKKPIPTNTSTSPVSKSPIAAPPQKSPVSSKTSSAKIWIIIILLVLLGAAIGFGYWWFTRSEPLPQQPTATIPFTEPEPVVPPPTTTVPVTPPIVTTTPTTTPTTTDTDNLTITGITFPQIISIDSVDVDEDSLTDEEERIFGTDPTIWDSDADSFYDGQEIYNLYNPRGEAPVRLIDSGLVRDFTNPQWRYRVFYPSSWEIGRVDVEGRQVLFSSISGEFVELRVFEKSANITFQDWFGQTISGQSFSDIEPFTNRFDIDGYIRRDSLVAYFPSDTEVVVMVYNVPETVTELRYRNIMRMMVQSFRPGNVTTADNAPQVESVVQPRVSTTSTEMIVTTSTDQGATTSTEDTTEVSVPGSGIPGFDQPVQ